MAPRAKATSTSATRSTNSDSAKMKDPSSQKEAPWLLSKWQQIYRSVPHVYVPFTNLDVSITLLSAILLYIVRYLGYLTLGYLGWPENDVVTKEAAGSIAAIAHSMTLLPALCVALWTQPYKPSSRMDSHPQWWQDAVVALLQFCTGYMVYDSIASFVVLRWDSQLGKPVLSNSDWMFLGHHFATAFYMTSTRVIAAGHVSAMICMTIGEFTNPLHNAYLISEVLLKLPNIGNSELASNMHEVIEFMFAALYCLARIVVGPIAMLHISYDVVLSKSGRSNIPLVLKILWLIMIWGVVFGSIPWIQECWGMLEKRYNILMGSSGSDEL